MGPLPIAILIGCLQGLKYLLWLVSALLVALVLTQALRGDTDARPAAQLRLAAALLAGGLGCGYAARWFLKRQQ